MTLRRLAQVHRTDRLDARHMDILPAARQHAAAAGHQREQRAGGGHHVAAAVRVLRLRGDPLRGEVRHPVDRGELPRAVVCRCVPSVCARAADLTVLVSLSSIHADRIAEQKFTIRMLVKLYRHSSDIPWRSDTLHDGNINKGAEKKPRKLFKKALQGMRFAATTTTTILGNVATEIAGR